MTNSTTTRLLWISVWGALLGGMVLLLWPQDASAWGCRISSSDRYVYDGDRVRLSWYATHSRFSRYRHTGLWYFNGRNVGRRTATYERPRSNTRYTARAYFDHRYYYGGDACEDRRRWNPTACSYEVRHYSNRCSTLVYTRSPMRGNIYGARGCRVAPNARSCNGYIRWYTRYGWPGRYDSAYIYNYTYRRVESWARNGSRYVRIQPNRNRIRLMNYSSRRGYSRLDDQFLYARCALGTRWTGGRCRRYSDNTLIYRAPDCRIQANRRTCTSRIYWRAYGHRSGDTTYLWDDTHRRVLSWSWRGAVNASVPYGTHRFRLINYNRELGYDTMARQYVRATCAAGTYRSGSYCRRYNDAQLLTTTNCTIPANRSSCTTSVNWSVPNYQSGDTPYVYDYTNRRAVPGSWNRSSGARNVTIGPGTHTFALWNYNASTGYDRLAVSRARATCASGSSWNGSECALPAPDISLVAEDDTVEYGTATRLYCDTNGFDGSCTVTPGNQSCKDTWLNTGALTETTTYTYTCTAPSGTYIDTNTKSATETITVTAPNISITASPALIRRGETTTISWDPNGYDGTCTLTPDDLFTNPDTIDFNTAGSAEITQPGEVTYTYTCTDTKDNYHNNETKSDSTTVRLVPMFGEV